MSLLVALIVIAFGVAVLIGGVRLWLIGGAIGALLGIALVNRFAVAQNEWLPIVFVVVLAIVFGVLAVLLKKFAGLAIMGLGFFAGGAIVFALLDALGLGLGLITWALAVAGGAIAAVLAGRFKDWAFIVLAELVGALLIVRGVQIILPASGWFALLLGVVAAGGGIYYHLRNVKRG